MRHRRTSARAHARAPGRLVIDDHAGEEHAAHRAAVQVMTGGRLSRSVAGLGDHDGSLRPAPASVERAIAAPGRPLGSAERSVLEAGFGAPLDGLRVHTGAAATRSADDVDAAAYAVGNHVVVGDAASAQRGRYLLAHEVAHVVGSDTGSRFGVVRRYRKRSAFAFGELDTATLVEDSFDKRRDKETKPWIKLITVVFDGTSTDADGAVFSTGTATAEYYANPVALPPFTLTVSGGSGRMKTDRGSFTVHRLETVGYNSGSASGTPGVDFFWSDREPSPHRRYSNKDPLTGVRKDANMNYAVFYNKGEALHHGLLSETSHGCVHVGSFDLIKQLNYHSVIGWTKVKVSYTTP